ncbi:MAG: 23S rRNA (uracil(1939)-C(5))-methyltransferase RlmD [Erysipelotrichales bacterium]|nr:23S rRNA (uracil(1939)-C(5))-methyltransferase RlmD [Erysipelotrichales bacterium]
MKKKKNFDLGTITGTCVDYTYDGKGIVRTPAKPVFVDALLVGEKADIKLNYEKSEMYFGKIVKLHNLSNDRIKPLCPVSTACGGCCFQNLNYSAQLKFKKKKVEDAFYKIAHMKVKVDDAVGMDDPYFYRNKIQMPIGLNQKKEIISGFYRMDSHEIIPIKECFIEDKRAAHIIDTLKKLMKKHKILPYDEDTRTGIIRHCLIRTSKYYPQIMVVLVTNADSFPGRGNLVKDLHKECPEITTIVQNVNKRDTNVIIGEKENVLLGRGYILDELCGVKFQISSKSFYQVNPIQTEKLYQLGIEKANLKGTETILDAYCGIGTIGLIASSKVKHVIGVEIIKDAIKDARNNAKLNNITNVEYYAEDASKFILDLEIKHQKLDVVFIDPPRKGSDKVFLDALLKLKPEKIVYISCDPSTLARDVAYLNKTYEVKSVTPVDMFPMTFHVETVALLTRILKKE